MSERLPSQPLVRFLADLADRAAGSAVEPDVALLGDPRRILELRHHHLAGLAWVWLGEAELRRELPPDAVRPLKDYYVSQWLRSERLLLETAELIDLFPEDEVILLKGPHLAERFYGGRDRRAIEDVDLLVRGEDLPRACAIVERAGWRRLSWMPFGFAVMRRGAHYVDFDRDGIPLDLHHAIRVHPALAIDEDALWSRAPAFDVRGRRCRVLSDEHLLLALAVSLHFDLARGAIRLRALLDVWMVLRGLDSRIDWSQLLARRRPEGTDRICAAVLSLALGVFDRRSRHPELLRAAQATLRGFPVPETPHDCLRFLQTTPRHRLLSWWADLLPPPRRRALFWWAVGFPVRYAAARANLLPRLAARMRRTTSSIPDEDGPGRTHRRLRCADPDEPPFALGGDRD